MGHAVSVSTAAPCCRFSDRSPSRIDDEVSIQSSWQHINNYLEQLDFPFWSLLSPIISNITTIYSICNQRRIIMFQHRGDKYFRILVAASHLSLSALLFLFIFNFVRPPKYFESMYFESSPFVAHHLLLVSSCSSSLSNSFSAVTLSSLSMVFLFPQVRPCL